MLLYFFGLRVAADRPVVTRFFFPPTIHRAFSRLPIAYIILNKTKDYASVKFLL